MTSDETEGVLAVVARLGLAVRQLETTNAQQAQLIAEKNAEIEVLGAQIESLTEAKPSKGG